MPPRERAGDERSAGGRELGVSTILFDAYNGRAANHSVQMVFSPLPLAVALCTFLWDNASLAGSRGPRIGLLTQMVGNKLLYPRRPKLLSALPASSGSC